MEPLRLVSSAMLHLLGSISNIFDNIKSDLQGCCQQQVAKFNIVKELSLAVPLHYMLACKVTLAIIVNNKSDLQACQ